jgi:integrase
MSTKRRSPGDGGLFKRNDGMWTGSVEIPSSDGKRRQRRVFSKNRNEAIRKLKALKADVDAGRVAYTSRTTVEAWLARWIEDIRGPKLRPGTKDDYARTIRLHINPHIGTKRLDRLSAQDVRVMQTSIQASRTAQLAHVILRSALGDAIKEGMLTRNVAEVAEKPKHSTRAREPLSSPQAKQLLRSAIDSDDPWATRWAAALLLGARQGEILGLQWSRLDLDNGIADFAWQLQQLEQAHGCGTRHSDGTWPCGKVRVGYCPSRHWDLPRGFEHQVLHRSLALTAPKTKAGTRIVPIPAPLWVMLKKQRPPRVESPKLLPAEGGLCPLPSGRQDNDNPHDLVWHHDDGRPISPRDDYDNWQTALETAGLPPAPLHIARNTCATLLAEAGVPEDIRMAILGQVSITAHRSYVYRDQAQTRQAMTALDQLLQG